MTVAERFWEKADRSGDCWIWMASLDSGGYGHFWYGGRLVQAHRVSWILANGPIPSGKQLNHRCHDRRCVRPDHLYLGTQSENIHDTEGAARGRHPRGEANGRARLTAEQVRALRVAYRPGRKGNLSKLARIVGMTRGGLHHVVTGHVWKEVRA